MAGFESVYALDFDKNAAATYKRNHPDTTIECRDIAGVDPSEVIAAAGGREIDLLAGGPSCQGYSTHGKRKADDPRNFLFEHFIRIAAGIRPKCILIENVQGLLTYNKGFFRDKIIGELNALGYHAEARVLCAADYGVPQLRRRIFFLATRLGSEVVFPSPTHAEVPLTTLGPYVTVGDALGDLPLLGNTKNPDRVEYVTGPTNDFQRYARTGSRWVTLHEARSLSAQALKIAHHVSEGSGLRSIPLAILPDRFKKMRTISSGNLRKDCTTLYYRLSRNRPAYTITCFFRNIASGPFLHPIENRSLSCREAARLMSFRDSYRFEGTSVARQIGNAVPPLLARAVGGAIREILSLAQAPKSKRPRRTTAA
jgi:DNA (cytosine-5)-methyltransferase 1